MSDLIERLHAAPYKVESWNITLYTEAAERIENLEAQRRALQEQLAAALKAKEPRIYKACPKHQGLTWNFMATVAMPAVEVCPHCEQEAMKK